MTEDKRSEFNALLGLGELSIEQRDRLQELAGQLGEALIFFEGGRGKWLAYQEFRDDGGHVEIADSQTGVCLFETQKRVSVDVSGTQRGRRCDRHNLRKGKEVRLY